LAGVGGSRWRRRFRHRKYCVVGEKKDCSGCEGLKSQTKNNNNNKIKEYYGVTI
jgi:hypothetical protein